MSTIADSNITKRALAAALKELMEEMSFAKISISDICLKCDMNRKSFYYHFKDKYDLLNWIFDTECIAIANVNASEKRIELAQELCRYLYENRRFYRNALQVRGQNSFLDHFHELIHIMGVARVQEIFDGQDIPEMCVNFAVDSFTCAIVRWISEKEPMPPEEFVDWIVYYVEGVSTEVLVRLNRRRQQETASEDKL